MTAKTQGCKQLISSTKMQILSRKGAGKQRHRFRLGIAAVSSLETQQHSLTDPQTSKHEEHPSISHQAAPNTCQDQTPAPSSALTLPSHLPGQTLTLSHDSQLKTPLAKPQKDPWVSTDISLMQLHHCMKTRITLREQLSSSELNNPSQPCSTVQCCTSAKQLAPTKSEVIVIISIAQRPQSPSRTGVAHPLFQLNTVIRRAAQGCREPN